MSDADLDRRLAEWAARHAPELIARAQADALEEARARLQAHMVEALMAAASREPREERAATSDPLLWVYGVMGPHAGEPPARAGVDDRPVRLHRHAGMTALVSDVPRDRFGEAALSARLEDLSSLEALARAHEGVLQTALETGVVVPFRLCTICSSAARLEALLDQEALALTAALDRLDGMQEWGVKAYLRAPAAVTGPAPATGTEYLSRKRERGDAAEASETVVAEIHSRLTEAAAAAALSRPHDRRLSGREAEMLLNAAYLVPSERLDAFRLVVEELRRAHEPDGIELELTGPWPPHHFVDTPEP